MKRRITRGVCIAGLALGAALMARSAAAADLPMGRYECWNGRSARMMFNFEVVGPGRYRDGEGTVGRFAVDGDTVRFSGGVHDGRQAAYHAQPAPTVNFMAPSGLVLVACELQK
jgi:hypothetical protein